MYKKNVLNEVGSFNPYIWGEEELELAFRIRQKKYELHFLNINMGIHEVKQKKTSKLYRIKYYQGIGQLLKMYRGKKFSLELLKKYYFHFIIFFSMVLFFPSIFLSFLGLMPYFLWKVICIIGVTGFLIIARLKGGIFKSLNFILKTFLESVGIMIGLLKYEKKIIIFYKSYKK